MKKSMVLLALLAFLAFPTVTHASWWNPTTWFNNWTFVSKKSVRNEELNFRLKELEKKLQETNLSMENEFEGILRKIRPTESVLMLTKAVLSELWQKKEGEITMKKVDIEKRIKSLENEKKILLERVTRALDDNVIEAYEAKISEFSDNIAVLKSSLVSFDLHRPNIGTALDIVFDFLRDPLKQWENGNIHTKKLVLRLVFEQNLVYSRKNGFETAFLSLPLRVFTLPKAVKSSVVLSIGIEPIS